MGTDIHVYAETLQQGTNRWIPAECQPVREAAFIWRDYTVFGALAGVRRTNTTPIDEPRGLPEDISDHGKQVFMDLTGMGYNLHHVSWLRFDEIIQHPHYADYIIHSHFDQWMHYIHHVIRDFKKDSDYRVIFGFDN